MKTLGLLSLTPSMQEISGRFIICDIKVTNTLNNKEIKYSYSENYNDIKKIIQNIYNERKDQLLIDMNKRICEVGDQLPIIIEFNRIDTGYGGPSFCIIACRQIYKKYNNEEKTKIRKIYNESLKTVFNDVIYVNDGKSYKLTPQIKYI